MAAAGGVDDLCSSVVEGNEYDQDEESASVFLGRFFLDEASAEDAAAEKTRRRKEQQEAYNKALRQKEERRDADRKLFMAHHHPNRRGCGSSNPGSGTKLSSSSAMAVKDDEEEEWECEGLEPFFFDEAEVVAEHAAAEEKRKRKEQEEAREQEVLDRRRKAHMSAMDAIRDYDHKHKESYFNRFYFVDLTTFDLDEESPLGPMRYTDTPINMDDNVHKQGQQRFLLDDSPNIFSVKIVSSDLGFLINVYGTVIARDSLDKKCVYLFCRDRDHCQLINSEDESLILTGPKRGLALVDRMYFEMNLKIKCDRGQKDKQLSNGFLTLDGVPRNPWDKMKVETDFIDTKLSTVEVMFAVVKRPVEATIAIELLQGEFYGEITACTSTIRNSLVLYDSKVAEVMSDEGSGGIQLLRNIVVVSLNEDMLLVTIIAHTGGDKTESTIDFAPRVNGADKTEVTYGSVKMVLKVTWSIIE